MARTTHSYEVIGSRGGRYVVVARDEQAAAEAVAGERVSLMGAHRDAAGWLEWARATQPCIATRPTNQKGTPP